MFEFSNYLFNKKRQETAFTLVELLVVVAIIGILSGIAIFGTQGARESSRDARRKSDLETIRSALELYRADCNYYPPTIPAAGLQLTGTGCNTNVYLNSVPGDPIPGRLYMYRPGTAPATRYTLCASLEAVTTGTCVVSPPSPNCGTGFTCNYNVSNP